MKTLAPEVSRFKITTPVVSDEERRSCIAFSVECDSPHHGRKPGHAFVLINANSQVVWTKDYGGQMYVEPREVFGEITRALQRS